MIKKSEYPSRHFRLFALMWLVVLIALLFLSGCNFGSKGSGSGSGASGDTVIASIKIKPGGLMFTRRGESKKLSATAYNAAGEELNITDFTWTTSKPSSVSIDSNGQATSQTDLGSAMITARAGDISSTPMLVNIALPVPGAILIDDTQVVGDIRPHNINEPLTLGSVYDVTLTGMTRPEVADILISTGSAPVAGRVVEVRETNGQYIVTLKLVDLDELFTAISINETLPMPESDIEINPALETTYNISQKPGGMLVFAPKPGVITASSNLVASGQAHTIKQAATGTRRIISVGPFACNFDGSNVFPLRLTAAPAFTVTSNLGFDLIMDGIYMRRAVITGTLTLENTDSWMLNSDLIGKLTCEIEIGVLPVPVSGWVSLFVGGFVPFGLGMELSGEISLTQLGFEMKSKTGGDVEFGFEIPENGDFHIVRNYTQTDNTFETRWITPNSSIASSLRLKPSLAAYGYANLDIGFRRPRYANWKVVASKLGLKLGADLALVDGQIEDINYASDYKLSLEYNIGPGSDITDYLNRLGLNLGSAGITLSTPLFESPKALSITADVDTFFENDFINFTVKLDQETIEDIFAYNVSSVQIYHRETDASGNIIGRYIGQKAARNGQTKFNIRWLADYDGEVNDEFYAYVVSRFLPFPFFDSLELGVVEPIVTGKIVFINDPDFMGSQLPYLRNMGIYTMNADGSELTKLVDGDSPAWSPDGSKIAFISGNAIWVMDADGSNWIKLVDGDNASPPGGVWHPVWSPDGSKIAYFFESGYDWTYSGFKIINSDGSAGINLIDNDIIPPLINLNDSILDGRSNAPLWSRDGSQIYFIGEPKVWSESVTSRTQIMAMDIGSGVITPLTAFEVGAHSDLNFLSQSPDKTKIAFSVGGRNGEDIYELYILSVNGSGIRQLTNERHPHQIRHIAWSPDNTKIVYACGISGDGMKVINADGSGLKVLLNEANVWIQMPSWSKDGTSIVFVRNGEDDLEIYKMHEDGTNIVRLTNNRGADLLPMWQP